MISIEFTNLIQSKHPKYLYKTEESFQIFEFVSGGPKGRVGKSIQYSETGIAGIYNLTESISTRFR